MSIWSRRSPWATAASSSVALVSTSLPHGAAAQKAIALLVDEWTRSAFKVLDAIAFKLTPQAKKDLVAFMEAL